MAHALAAADFSYAAALMEKTVEEVWLHGEIQTLYRWVMALPDTILHNHARLALTAVLYLLNATGQTSEEQRVSARIQAERMIVRVESVLRNQGENILPVNEMALLQRRKTPLLSPRQHSASS